MLHQNLQSSFEVRHKLTNAWEKNTACLILLPNFLVFSCETQGKFDVASDVIKT